jgi:hypothetical protein
MSLFIQTGHVVPVPVALICLPSRLRQRHERTPVCQAYTGSLWSLSVSLWLRWSLSVSLWLCPCLYGSLWSLSVSLWLSMVLVRVSMAQVVLVLVSMALSVSLWLSMVLVRVSMAQVVLVPDPGMPGVCLSGGPCLCGSLWSVTVSLWPSCPCLYGSQWFLSVSLWLSMVLVRVSVAPYGHSYSTCDSSMSGPTPVYSALTLFTVLVYSALTLFTAPATAP